MNRPATVIGFINGAHFIDHYAMLVFAAAVIVMGPALNLPYGELLPYATPGFVMFGAGSLLNSQLLADDRSTRIGAVHRIDYGEAIVLTHDRWKFDAGGIPQYSFLLATAQEILNEEVGAIRRLVDDFSAFAKLPKVEPAPVDLAQVIEDFARAHPEWQEFLKVDRNGQVGALCDRMLLRNVLANLVENAVQAATAAGRKPEIRIAVSQSAAERDAHLTVDDNGPGVPADARERIFDPYFTTKEHGLGMGLSICRNIVSTHGGRLWADDNGGGGTRFHFTIPVAEVAA